LRIDGEITAAEIYQTLGRISEHFFVPSHEVLCTYGEKAGYSLAQGQ
jgi:hypothetical protein